MVTDRCTEKALGCRLMTTLATPRTALRIARAIRIFLAMVELLENRAGGGAEQRGSVTNDPLPRAVAAVTGEEALRDEPTSKVSVALLPSYYEVLVDFPSMIVCQAPSSPSISHLNV
jgi:hypothetical protein